MASSYWRELARRSVNMPMTTTARRSAASRSSSARPRPLCRSGLSSRGLLPTAAETLAQQVHRRYQACQEQPADDTATGVARAVAKAAVADAVAPALTDDEIEERRVGKECRSR